MHAAASRPEAPPARLKIDGLGRGADRKRQTFLDILSARWGHQDQQHQRLSTKAAAASSNQELKECWAQIGADLAEQQKHVKNNEKSLVEYLGGDEYR